MAEEHIVLPRERYQRMLDQLAEKKQDHDQAEGSDRQQEENSASNKDTPSPTDVATSSSEDSSDSIRTRDDVTGNETDRHTSSDISPPGITPEELKKLVHSKQNKNVKSRPPGHSLAAKKGNISKSPRSVTTSKTKRKMTPKSLAQIKKNWSKIA